MLEMENGAVARDISEMTPQEFMSEMTQLNITRGYFTYIDGQFKVSHSALSHIGDFIFNSPDFQQHEGLFFEIDTDTDCMYIVCVHDTHRGAGHGGTRFKQYNTIGGILTDAMRLAKGMTDKNACAGLWWGGGKAVIYSPVDPRTIKGEKRTQIFTNYGRFVASLNGVYISAEDMNTTVEDMRIIHANNRFCTCLPVEIGGSANPSIYTAIGVFKGLVAGVHFLDGINNPNHIDLTGKHVLLQGAGNVGYALLEMLVKAGAKVTVFEMRESTKAKIRAAFPASQVQIEEDYQTLLATEADVFAPCAIGAIINDTSLPKLKVKLIAGAANNQLKDPIKHAVTLHKKGIAYVPDFIINRMGIVNCANEPNGYIPEEVEVAANNVYPAVYELLENAQKTNQSPQFEALDLARRLAQVEHPILGHRGKKIIKRLMQHNWEES